jgi:hypothetical protein
MFHRVVMAATVALVLLVSHSAHAGGILWQTTGSSCTAGSTSYTTAGATISSTSGTETEALCPIFQLATVAGACSTLTLTPYTRSNSTSYGRIYPYVVAVSKSSGVESYVGNTGGSYVGPTNYVSGYNAGTIGFSFSISSFDFVHNFYYAIFFLDGAYPAVNFPSIQGLVGATITCQ